MSTSLFTPSRDRQVHVWAAAAALVVSLAGCSGQATAGSDEPDSTPVPPESTPSGEGPRQTAASEGGPEPADADTYAGDGFCADVEGIGDELRIANYTNDGSSDAQGYIDTVAAATDRFATVEPPADIADSWEVVADFFSFTNSHLEGVDTTQPDAISNALSFDSEEPDAFVMAIQTPGHSEMIAVFVQQECGVDLGVTVPPLLNVCDAIDEAHLESVFTDTIPAGENRPWSNGVVECLWGDGDGTEVGIVVGPLDAVLPDLLQGQEPLNSNESAGATIDVYDGALGPLRSAAGRTAATDDGQNAVLASVRTSNVETAASQAVALVDVTMRAIN